MIKLENLKKELQRMTEKRNQICIELGSGYDWMLVDSLFAIAAKIKQYEKRIQDRKESEKWLKT